MKEILMLYRDYKSRFSNIKSIPGTYNPIDKTIQVVVPDDFQYTIPDSSSATWVKIPVPSSEIKPVKGGRYMIHMPYRSEYRHYQLFISGKLVKTDEFGEKELLICSEHSFCVSYENEKLEISADELIEALTGWFNIPKKHIPEALEPLTNVEALKELIDDEEY